MRPDQLASPPPSCLGNFHTGGPRIAARLFSVMDIISYGRHDCQSRGRTRVDKCCMQRHCCRQHLSQLNAQPWTAPALPCCLSILVKGRTPRSLTHRAWNVFFGNTGRQVREQRDRIGPGLIRRCRCRGKMSYTGCPVHGFGALSAEAAGERGTRLSQLFLLTVESSLVFHSLGWVHLQQATAEVASEKKDLLHLRLDESDNSDAPDFHAPGRLRACLLALLLRWL